MHYLPASLSYAVDNHPPGAILRHDMNVIYIAKDKKYWYSGHGFKTDMPSSDISFDVVCLNDIMFFKGEAKAVTSFIFVSRPPFIEKPTPLPVKKKQGFKKKNEGVLIKKLFCFFFLEN